VTATDNRCDICNGESKDSKFVGVAAVPGAPVSVAWCQNCLQVGAVPMFVVETWLFTEFDPAYNLPDPPIPMPEERPQFPLAPWAGEMKIWRNGRYISVEDAWPELWEEEKARHGKEEAS